jgi:glutamyl-tRNA reductase
MLVDIGVPRNITDDSGNLVGVDAYDVDLEDYH